MWVRLLRFARNDGDAKPWKYVIAFMRRHTVTHLSSSVATGIPSDPHFVQEACQVRPYSLDLI